MSQRPLFDHWPASLPQIAYVAADGGFLCVTCANAVDAEKLDPACPDDNQWRIIGAQVNEDTTECSHCGRQIISRTSMKTPTIYELNADGQAIHAHQYCSVDCRNAALVSFPGIRIDVRDVPYAHLADGGLCDHCGKPLKDGTSTR